jgi:serine/threonine protein kinase
VPYLFKISLNIGRSESGSNPVVTLDHQGKPISVKTLKEPRWGDIQILDYKAPNDA